jgi:putative DNA primase/helicase
MTMACLAALPDELQFILDQGCRILPGNDKKYCSFKNWPSLASDDPNQIAAWLEDRPASWLMQTGTRESGGSDRVVVEYDSERGRQWLADLHLPRTLTTESGRGSHLHYIAPPGDEIHSSQGNNGGLAPDVDVKGWHSVAVIPPSIHKNGRPYAYQRHPAVVLPDTLAQKMRDLWLVHNLPRPQAGHHDPAPFETARRYHGFRALNQSERERHRGLLRSAGKMRHHGADADQITTKLLAENIARCNPPNSPDEVIQLAHDVASRYEPFCGLDPLAEAWDKLNLCDAAHPRFKIIALARELAASHPIFLLPQLRLSELLHVPQTTVSRIIRTLIAERRLCRVGDFEPCDRAQRYTLLPP